jgi:hypothetical protein
MASTLRFPGHYNGFLPEETGMIVSFVKEKGAFAVTEYVQFVPHDQPIGLYRVLERDQFIRVVSQEENAWEDGDPAPTGEANKIRAKLEDWRSIRKVYPWILGEETAQLHKSWDLKKAQMDEAVRQCMTALTDRVNTLLDTTSNWPTGHAKAANTLNGGRGPWNDASADPDSPSYLAIFRTLQGAYRQVHLATNGRVKMQDMRVVIGVDAAIAISETGELNHYVQHSPYAKEVIEKGLDPQFNAFGMPSMYRGYTFIVEDSPIVEERPKASGVEATTARTYIKDPTTAWFVSRKGGLEGLHGSPSFSTVQVYHKGDLTEVEAFSDPENRRVKGRVVNQTAEVLPAGLAGMHISDVLG